jgi:phosphonate transport system substrate-binding protein
VWDARVKAGQVDPSKVTEVFRTPPYHDYHWLARPDLDAAFGGGFTDRVRETLLGIALFTAGSFVPTAPENYTDIETVARQLGLVQ